MYGQCLANLFVFTIFMVYMSGYTQILDLFPFTSDAGTTTKTMPCRLSTFLL